MPAETGTVPVLKEAVQFAIPDASATFSYVGGDGRTAAPNLARQSE